MFIIYKANYVNTREKTHKKYGQQDEKKNMLYREFGQINHQNGAQLL